MESFPTTDGPCWFLIMKFDGVIWQLFVEGDVEQEGASPSVVPGWTLSGLY